MIYIMLHDDDNWDSLWLIESTDGSNGNWSNIMIIGAANV